MSIEIYPVIHFRDEQQALEQSSVARDTGADGVYLIEHGTDVRADDLVSSFERIKAKYPDFFVGINFLQFASGLEAFGYILQKLHTEAIYKAPDGLWVDDIAPRAESADYLRHVDERLNAIRYLGGIAFKYTPTHTEDPGEAWVEARRLSRYADVVTTSGPGTGRAASPEKIAAMKRAIGLQPLAIASGVTPENLADYQGQADQVLVATSIETRPGSGEFDVQRLGHMVAVAHRL